MKEMQCIEISSDVLCLKYQLKIYICKTLLFRPCWRQQKHSCFKSSSQNLPCVEHLYRKSSQNHFAHYTRRENIWTDKACASHQHVTKRNICRDEWRKEEAFSEHRLLLVLSISFSPSPLPLQHFYQKIVTLVQEIKFWEQGI